MAKLHQAVVPDRAPGYANRSPRDLRSHLKLLRRARIPQGAGALRGFGANRCGDAQEPAE
jgi:hypothetical protein